MKIDDTWYLRPKEKGFPTKVNAGGVVIRKYKGRLLIALIRDRSFPDYSLPKGGVEKGESVIKTAKREIAEETGLKDLHFICELGAKERLTFEKDKWATTHYFLFTTAEENGQQNLQGEEDLEVKWFDIENLPKIFWSEQQSLIEDDLEKIKTSV